MATAAEASTTAQHAAPPPRAPFNIRLWFAVVSLVVIAALGGAFGYLMSDLVTRRLLYREAELTQEFLQSIVLAEHTARDVFRPETPDGRESMESFTDHMIGLPGVFRSNMYALDRRIVWSTDQEMIGKRFESNHELEDAFRGKLLVEIGRTEEVSAKAEHVALRLAGARRFIEVYMPMRDQAGEVVGVVEFYKSPDALELTIRSAHEIIWSGVVVGALVLYGALFWVVRRGAQVIEGQQRQLTSMETMAALGQMAGAMAHSLRNPLAGLRSSAELVASGDLDSAPEAARSIVAEADRMDRHIRDLLIYTRAERLEIQPLDPLDVARTCLVDARAELERRRITADVEGADDPRRRIAADSVLLRQAIASLVSNALEAMDPGGSLKISATGQPSAGKVRLEIIDSGRGMEPETLKQVATPFFTTKPMGLGLGLVLARRIVERFGGTLTIESAPGRGTRVAMVFPALR